MMLKKDTRLSTCTKTTLVLVVAMAISAIWPTYSQASTKTAVCEVKPLMQKQLTASYAQSSYADCQKDPELCKDMYAEPQTTAIKTDKAATVSAKATAKMQTPKASPSPTPSPSVDPTPSPVTASSSGLSADKLFEMINSHRATKGLPAYEKEDRVCQLAQSRGPELHNEIFGSGYVHQGLQERNLPFWITENMISRDTEEAAMRWWLNSSIHRAGIESSKKYACGVCVANSCAMLFTSWEPK